MAGNAEKLNLETPPRQKKNGTCPWAPKKKKHTVEACGREWVRRTIPFYGF